MRALTVAILFCLAGCGQLLMGGVDQRLADLPQGNYRLDPHHTTVLFKVGHLGVSQFVGRFNRSEASLNYDPERPAQSSLTADVWLQSLDVNRPDFAETLTGCQWLCAERFPKARFVSRGEASVEANRLTFDGDLTFHGVTRPASLTVTINGGTTNRLTGDYTLGFEARMRFNRSDFGVDRYIPAVGDEVSIEVYAEFIPAD